MASLDCPSGLDPDPDESSSGNLARRAVVAAGIGAAALASAPLSLGRGPRADAASSGSRCWSSASGWAGGSMPSSTAVVRVTDHVIVDRNVTVGGLVIEPGASVVFAPDKSVALTSRGNVVVHGDLQMAPADCTAEHALVFAGIDESRFVGGMELLSSDIGLWVRGEGRLFLDGCAKTAWARADGDLVRGASTIRLQEAPVDWHPDDELVIAPTGSPQVGDYHDQYDTVRIVSVSGRAVTVSPTLSFDHLAHAIGRSTVVSAEVMNLSRNVRIEGTPSGRAHVHIMGNVPQDMRNFALRHVGPRRRTGEHDFTDVVLGRYGLHFHMAGDATRGTRVEGAVVRDAGSHAYVPHASHGITFRSCISHNTMDDAYWWDGALDTRTPQVPTNDLVFDGCIASRITCDPAFRGYRLSGFSLGAGQGNSARSCTAVGVQGNENASGFQWPEGGVGLWDFADCMAHNNRVDGIFTWQNTVLDHVVTRFVGYHNGGSGIEHGAYINSYLYEDSILFGNGQSSVRLHALSGGPRRLTLDNLWCDGGGISRFGLELVKHTLDTSVSTLVARCVFKGHRDAAVALLAVEGPVDHVDFVDCEVSGNEFFTASSWVGGSVRWQDSVRGAFGVTPISSGSLQNVSAWNADRGSLLAFAPRPSPASRVPLAVPTIAARTSSRGLTSGSCVSGAGGMGFPGGSTPTKSGSTSGHSHKHASKKMKPSAKLVRGKGRKRHLIYITIDNPGAPFRVDITADGHRLRTATAGRGHTTVAIRNAKVRGRTVRLRHGDQTLGRWRVAKDSNPSSRYWFAG